MLDRESATKVKVDNPARKIEFEVGDAMQDDFFPQFKTKHWDNECNFSARLVAGQGAVTEHDGKLAYDDGEQIARFYEKDTGDEDGGFEFDVVLPKKPKSNVIRWTIQHKGLDFFYQPELTPKDIEEGAERPENVVGSYAVYHKTGRNNKVGGKEYRTGKAFHIYRPKAHDALNNEVWCDLNIDEVAGELTVTVPQDFLNSATYPVVVDPTFGYTTAGGSYGNGFGKTTYSKAILSEDGDLTQLSMYIDWNFSGSGTFNSAIYSDSSGAASKLATADAIAKSNGVAWEDASISYSATADTYWLAESDGSGSANYRWYYDTGTAGDSDSDTTYTVLPTTASLSGTLTNYLWSIYATYTASGGGGGRRRIIIT